MEQNPIVQTQASAFDVDNKEFQKHQDFVPGAGAAAADSKAVKNDQESGSDHDGPGSGAGSCTSGTESESKAATVLVKESGSGCSGSDSSVSDPLEVFTRDGTMYRVSENTPYLKTIKMDFIDHMNLAAGETTVVAVHEYPDSNLTQRARVADFRTLLDKKYGVNVQNARLYFAMYSGSKEKIAQILVHGFSAVNDNGDDAQYGCVLLVPAPYYLEAALSCVVDEAGLRHLLVCRVSMGSNVQVVPHGFNAFHHVFPGFDSGVDSDANPRVLFVPTGSAKDRIIAESVLSFRAPARLWNYTTYATELISGFFGASQRLPINLLKVLNKLVTSVTPAQMATALELYSEYNGNEMSRGELIGKLKVAVGEGALVAAANAAMNEERNEATAFELGRHTEISNTNNDCRFPLLPLDLQLF